MFLPLCTGAVVTLPSSALSLTCEPLVLITLNPRDLKNFTNSNSLIVGRSGILDQFQFSESYEFVEFLNLSFLEAHLYDFLDVV